MGKLTQYYVLKKSRSNVVYKGIRKTVDMVHIRLCSEFKTVITVLASEFSRRMWASSSTRSNLIYGP